MRGKQTAFFATKEDLFSVMENIESKFDMEYIEMGIFNSQEIIRNRSLTDITNNGYTNFPNWISLDNRFMLIERDIPLKIREVILKDGTKRYAIDPMLNIKSVELSTGGIYTKKQNVLIAGRVGTVYDNDFSGCLYKAITAEMRKKFEKIDSFYVGITAKEKLKNGWRLVTSEKSPKERDLKMT